MRAALRRPLSVRRHPAPASLVGLRILPTQIEVWHDRPSRRHDRVVFKLKDGGWEEMRLYL